MDEDELFLCKPCMVRMTGLRTVSAVRELRKVRTKGDCEQCGLRRYGYICEVTFREVPADER